MKMKARIVLLSFIILLGSCSENSMIGMDNESIDMGAMNDKISYQGTFVSVGHPTSGLATVNENKTILSFKNFKTDNGPKLLVYLSTTTEDEDFVNLGDLKGIEGNYDYTIPQNTDIATYKYVVIWCVDFSVSFGHAELK